MTGTENHMGLLGWLKGLLGRGGFTTIRDDQGNVMVIDPATRAYLRSRAPNPTQASLDSRLNRTTRVRVIDGGMSQGKVLGKTIWLETEAAEDLAVVRRGLRIVEDPATFGHCMCLGDFVIELCRDRKRLAALSWHHGRSIRWTKWKHDALLVDGEVILDWLEAKGVSGPREAYDAAARDAERYRTAAERWWAAMPECLRPFQKEMVDATRNTPAGEWLAALEAAYPDKFERARVVMGWFGQGMGPWSGYPSYEGAAEALLLAMPTEVLVMALEQDGNDEATFEGAARYFAGWYFRQRKGTDHVLLSPRLKARLLAQSIESDDADKVQRAKAAFGR